MTDRIPTRRVRFEWPKDLNPIWTPRVPELSLAANAVSLLMPHAEPYVVASVRAGLDEIDDLDPDLEAEARAYVHQEAQHHGQHRRFNDVIIGHYPRLTRHDRTMAWIFARLRRRSTRFGLAFAAGFESIAFVAARWVDKRQALFRDADPTATTLFLWHLAEEVEHKEVAWDIYQAAGGGRLRYAWAITMAALVLATTAMVATWSMLRAEGRLFSPLAHVRLVGWSLSFVFAAMPVMAVTVWPGHHPSDLVNPAGLEQWLDHLDPETSIVPEWALP